VLTARAAYVDTSVATVSAPVGGRISAIAVRPGDRVAEGQELARIFSGDIAAAAAALAQAREARVLADEQAARAALLLQQGAGSEADQQSSAAAAAEARAEEKRAAEALRAAGGAEGGSSEFILRSPRAGTVTGSTAHVGLVVSPGDGTSLFTVADLGRIWILADVRPRDERFVRVGEPATVQVDALPGRSFSGTISYLDAVVDPATQSLRARIELDDSDGAVRPGMFAQVAVTTAESGAALVPKTAVVAVRDRFYVYVARGGDVYDRREVTLGDEQGDDVVVRSGVAPGDPVVVRGAILLEAEANELL
jgi:cobalt-zinc-cadmium efflux system membrane fusion protein